MNRTQQQALKALLLTAPYSGLADAQAKADAVNTNVSQTKFRKVDYTNIISKLVFKQKIVPMLAVKDTNQAVMELLFLASSKIERLDLNDADSSASFNRLFDQLITDGLLTAQDKTDILAMAEMSVAEELGLGTVKWYDIDNAEAAQ